MGMATDYDAPRKNDDDTESIEALKERVPDKRSGVVDLAQISLTSISTWWFCLPRQTSSRV